MVYLNNLDYKRLKPTNLWHGVLLSMNMILVANVGDIAELHMSPADFRTIQACSGEMQRHILSIGE